MIVKFRDIPLKSYKNFMGGEGQMDARMLSDENGKINLGTLEPGCSIGMHTHTDSYEVILIVSGDGKVLYDDFDIPLIPGDCHYCPPGHSHSLINTGDQDLVFFAVIPNVK